MTTLKEQLEQEKKAGSDVKSLKTQQICTLTFKLANAVRQRELAEGELAKVKKEMEELKEVLGAQHEELKAEGEEGGNHGSGQQEESVLQECAVEETGEVNEQEKMAKDDTIVLSFPDKDERNRLNDCVDNGEVFPAFGEELKAEGEEGGNHGSGQQEESVPQECAVEETGEVNEQEKMAKDDTIVLSFPDKDERNRLNDCVDNGEVFPAFGEELKAEGEEGGNHGSGQQEESVPQECAVEETGEVNEQEKIAKDDTIVLSFPEKDERNGLDDFVENREVFSSFDKKCDKLLNDDSLHEDWPTEVHSQDIPCVIGLLSSSLALTDEDYTKGNLSIRDKSEDVRQVDASLQSSLSGPSDTNEESPRENGEELEKIREDVCQVQENAIKLSDTSYELVEDTQNATKQKNNTLETLSPCSVQNFPRIFSKIIEEDQISSPPTLPKATDYTEEKFGTLLTDNRATNQSPLSFFGEADEEPDVHLKDFLKKEGEENLTSGPGTVQEGTTLESFLKNEPVLKVFETGDYKSSDRISMISNTAENATENYIRKGSENEFFSQTVSQEVEDLKQQLKSAMQKIEELRIENKEMKKEIENLSSSTAEKAFLLKTTKFTDRLLRDMKEREAKVHVPQLRSSASDKIGLEREYGHTGLPAQSQVGLTGDIRRKTSIPLKIIGEKLKEITRSVENMAMDPESCESYFVDLKSPYRNYPFEMEEPLIRPSESKTFSAQSSPFYQDNPGQTQRGCYTSVQKLGEENLISPKTFQQQLKERDHGQGENALKLTDGLTHAPERCVYESPRRRWKLHVDAPDYVQRYVVRSSTHIANMRDLKPEEIAFYSKQTYK